MGENEEEKKLNVENEEKVQENVSSKEETTNEEVKKEESKVTAEKKEEPNFKKVETKTKKSKHGVAKAILILIGLLVVAYFIFVMRNYFILNDIFIKANTYKDTTSYSYHVKATLGEYTVIRKDNIIRVEQKSLEDEEREIIWWTNYDTNEEIVSFPNQKTAVKQEPSEQLIQLPFQFTETNDVMIGVALYTLIYTDEYDGKDCYVLCLSSDYKKWVEKDTGLIVKIESGENSFTEISNIEINNVDEIYKPDLTGYKITDNTKMNTTEE